MHTTPKSYIDYESFPIADLDVDRHGIQLPNSVLAARRKDRQKAIERERVATSPRKPQSHSRTYRSHLLTLPSRKISGRSSTTPSSNAFVLTRRSAPPSTPLSSSIGTGATPSPPASNTHPALNPLPAQNNLSKNEPGDLVQNNHFEPWCSTPTFARRTIQCP